MQRLGKNLGAYLGERIDLRAVIDDDLAAARRHGWQVETLPAGPDVSLLALRRSTRAPRRRLYLSTGIHGDEPAGPLAMRQLLQENVWPADADLWLCPCLNPTGFPLNRRASSRGIDLNRDYQYLQSDEVRAHVAWLERQPRFDLTLCLHEDWESNGFYVYDLSAAHQPGRAEAIVAAVGEVCPIDNSPLIEGRAARNGVIRPKQDPTRRPDWPEAFYLIHHKTPLSYTFEAPSDFPLSTRVTTLVVASRTAMEG